MLLHHMRLGLLCFLCVLVMAAAAQAATVYHGNTQTHIFHAPSCRYYSCKKCTAVFPSREAAVKSGFRPCKVCNP